MKTNELANYGRPTRSWIMNLVPSIAVCIACWDTFAQDLPFTSGSTGADGPFHVNASFAPARYSPGMVFDAARNEVVLFGGGTDTAIYPETWILEGTDWVQRNSTFMPTSAQLAYDEVRQEVIGFGSSSISSPHETFRWDGTNWTQLAPITTPPTRSYFQMAYDRARQEILLFGGIAVSSGPYLN